MSERESPAVLAPAEIGTALTWEQVKPLVKALRLIGLEGDHGSSITAAEALEKVYPSFTWAALPGDEE
ncbi:MAG: hypothetical protein ACRYG8_06695 [Janthinobacterium lividum]